MPSSGKRKSKSKKSGGGGARDLSGVDIPTVLDAYIDEINDSRGWDAVVELLCRMFDLPDLGKRSGLKKIHANFDDIQKKLEAAYIKYNDNEKVAGGIVGVWAAMCNTDSILRNKLFGGGLMERMLPLFDKRSTRYVGLQALSAVTHHGGSDIRRRIAVHTPRLVRLMEELPDDKEVNELAVVTLAHTTSAVVNDDESSPSVVQQNIRNLDIPAILRLVLRNARQPDVSLHLLTHTLELLSTIARPPACSKDIRAIPSLVSLLASGLRSKEITLRCSSLGGMMRLMAAEAVNDYGHLDQEKLLSAIGSGFPRQLEDVMMAYGAPRCDTYLIMQASIDFQKAMRRCVQTYDLYELGLKLSELVLRTEYSIADGMYQVVNERTGQMEASSLGLPFTMWVDSLPHCAQALRGKGSPADLDKSDILQCKYFIMRKQLPDALTLAKKAIARSPQVAYFYYVVGLSTADSAEGLRASKQGIKCTQTTPFVKNFLLWRATEHAADMGITKLQSCRVGDEEYSEGIAFLTSALEDAKMFVAEAPPDSRRMTSMLSWYILLTIALRGPELSIDLKELNLPLKKLELARKFSEFFKTPLLPTQLLLTRELVLKQYKTSYNEWSTVIDRLDQSYSSGEDLHRSAHSAKDNLTAWLDGLSIADDAPVGSNAPSLGVPSVELYRCSYCGNPSAVLRKCSGCGKKRYCDSGCQKNHWSDHKIACKKYQAESQAS